MFVWVAAIRCVSLMILLHRHNCTNFSCILLWNGEFIGRMPIIATLDDLDESSSDVSNGSADDSLRALSAYFFSRSILMEAFSHTFTSEVCLKPLSYTGNRFDAG